MDVVNDGAVVAAQGNVFVVKQLELSAHIHNIASLVSFVFG